MKSRKFIFAREDDVGNVAARAGLSANALAEIVDDHVVVLWLGFVFRGDTAIRIENAVEDLNQLNDADLKASFLEQFAGNTLLKGFTQLQRTAGNGPLTAQWFAASADQQGTAILNDYAPHADDRALGVFAGRCHNLQMERREVISETAGARTGVDFIYRGI